MATDLSNEASEVLDLTVEGWEAPVSGVSTTSPSALRERIPVLGLREYWYPAIVDKKVGQRRPTKIKMLGEQIVLFRAKNGEVKASTSVCPHRGGSMGDGHCHYAGTISCPYHGWTFDETGNCVAVLGEGPESPIPGNEGARLKMYPTITLKGCVFVWMGEREPADPKEDIPPEFFQDNAQIQYTVSLWTCNWRQALENTSDAHGYYVHKDSLQFIRTTELQMRRKLGPTRPRPRVINGRAVMSPTLVIAKGQFLVGHRDGPEFPFRDAYPGLDGQLYPKHEFPRLQWHRLMSSTERYRLRKDIDPDWGSEEWRGFHLPVMFRTFGQGNYVYTRNCVPVDENESRMFYYYATFGRTQFEQTANRLWYTFASNWFKNYNFSGQDQAVMEPQVYDQPEMLSATDNFSLATRRLIAEKARDF